MNNIIKLIILFKNEFIHKNNLVEQHNNSNIIKFYNIIF